MKLSKKTKTQIIEFFQNKADVVAVYLYGSYAQGEAGVDSDIDLGVVYDGKSYDNYKDQAALRDLTKMEVEVQPLGESALDFAHRVISQGKLLLDNDPEKRILFEEKLLREYFDIKPSLTEYYACLSEIARKGDLNVRYI